MVGLHSGWGGGGSARGGQFFLIEGDDPHARRASLCRPVWGCSGHMTAGPLVRASL